MRLKSWTDTEPKSMECKMKGVGEQLLRVERKSHNPVLQEAAVRRTSSFSKGHGTSMSEPPTRWVTWYSGTNYSTVQIMP